jgi:hypothetical protein
VSGKERLKRKLLTQEHKHALILISRHCYYGKNERDCVGHYFRAQCDCGWEARNDSGIAIRGMTKAHISANVPLDQEHKCAIVGAA